MTGSEYRARREALGLTQEELAVLLGVTGNTIHRRETGAFPVTREQELALERVGKLARSTKYDADLRAEVGYQRKRADAVCDFNKQLLDEKDALTAKLAEKEAELAEAQRYAVAESSKAHQEIIELRAQNRKLEAELEAARSVIKRFAETCICPACEKCQ